MPISVCQSQCSNLRLLVTDLVYKSHFAGGVGGRGGARGGQGVDSMEIGEVFEGMNIEKSKLTSFFAGYWKQLLVI